MKWKVVARPEAKDDILQAANWYDRQSAGLGDEFIEEVIAVFDSLTTDPLFQSRSDPNENDSLEISQAISLSCDLRGSGNGTARGIGAVLHAARHDNLWRQRFK